METSNFSSYEELERLVDELVEESDRLAMLALSRILDLIHEEDRDDDEP